MTHADEAAIEAVQSHAMSCMPATLARLNSYLRIPAISCDPAHDADVEKLALAIAQDVKALGLDNVRVLRLSGAKPLVAAEWLKAGSDKPTLLIYGHFDLQPVQGEPWDTPPHEPQVKDGRLYARGAADDMGGWVSHMAALEAWFAQTGSLPCNVKLVIEGEEEIGSPELERYMDEYPSVFEADVMVLTDCENPATDIPGLTVSLRGICEAEIHCEALKADVHSGLWGNMVPDPAMCLTLLLARLVDENGRMKLGRMPVDSAWRAASRDVPLDETVIREGARLAPGVPPLPEEERSPAEWLWRQPAITLLSTTLPTPDSEKNAVRGKASAAISLRLAPGQTKEQMVKLLQEVLLKDPPGGVKVELVIRDVAGESWLYEPKGPAFDAADRAYTRAWGRPLLQVGIGGSIPFVALFGRRYSNLPLILNGVLDPLSGAHGPNESLDLAVFEKAILANVALLAELAVETSLLGSNNAQ